MTDVLRTCGVRIDRWSRAEAVDRLVAVGTGRQPCAVHLINAYTLSLAARDADFASRLDAGDMNLIDGMPLVWLARRKGLPAERVYGPALFAETVDRGRARGLRHYLYGSTPDVVQQLANRLRAKYPGAEVVGVHSPPFRPLRPEEVAEFVDDVAATGAHIVWVGLGTPKQDEFVHQMRRQFPVPVVAVGAAFDFLAGTKRQAPGWMQRLGLEWLFRLASEPRRLWRRYLVGNCVFVWSALRTTRIVRSEP